MASRLCLSLFWLLLSITAWSQNIDALYKEFTESAGKQQIQLANDLFQAFYQKELCDSVTTFNEKSADQIDFMVNYIMSYYLYDETRYEEAMHCVKLALKSYIPSISTDDHAACLNQASVICQRKGDFYTALEYQKQCYEIDKASGDPSIISSSMNNLASLYIATRQPEEALSFILQAIKIERSLERDDKLAVRLGIASEVYNKLGKPEKALEMASEAYHIDHEAGRQEKAAIRQSQEAEAYIELHRYAEAEKVLSSAIPMLQTKKNNSSLPICYNQMGHLRLIQGKNIEAADYFLKAAEICEKTGNRYVESVARKGLSKALKDIAPGEALSHLERFSNLRDSMYREESASMLNQFHTRYDTDRLTEENNYLNTENVSQRKFTNRVIISALIILVLLITLLAILYYALRMRTKANRMMHEVERTRLDLFAKITHEFRTPLSIIIGMSDNILTGKTRGDTMIGDHARIIKRNGIHMKELTDQLLDISKIKSTFLPPEWRRGDIVAYTTMICESFGQLAKEKEITLKYEHPQNEIVGNFVPEYYRKILYNLISNAIKHTPLRGHVTLSTESKDSQFFLSIVDDGHGINKTDLPHIFEEFYTGTEHHATATASTGVGLSLVKQIIDALKGTISVTSQVGKGTAFDIILPFDITTHAPSFQADIEGNIEEPLSADNHLPIPYDDDDDSKKKILVVEDNIDMSHYITSLLSNRYLTIHAFNGREGMEKATEGIPDVIITDMMMPDTDGFTLCKNIRRSELLSHIPIIVVSAMVRDEDRIKALELGVDAYLHKPFNAQELLVRIEQLLEQRQMLRQKFSRMMDTSSELSADSGLTESDRVFLTKFKDTVVGQMLSGNTDVETIASLLCVSSKQLRRKIFALTGKTTISYILHIRLAEAKRLLTENSSDTISDIATKCGFDDNAHFARTFKQQYQVSPSQYRKNLKSSQG